MANPMDLIFKKAGQKIMTHVIAGYPNLETTETLVRLMASSGVDLVEIQIPFSDPMADGPAIATANQVALDNGTTPVDCFALVQRLSQVVDIPLLFMTYANIPFSMGLEHFVQRARISGISGFIIPDLPFDACPEYSHITRQYGCYAIPVVSPGMVEARLSEIVGQAAGFIYTTLRVGITGVQQRIEGRGLEFLHTLRSHTTLPIVAGFGISSVEMVKQLQNQVDGVVIGSHILHLLNTGGIEAVGEFLRECKKEEVRK